MKVNKGKRLRYPFHYYILGFVILLFLVSIIIDESPTPTVINTNTGSDSGSVLEVWEKDIICNDIAAYIDWCYDNSVSAEDCGAQMAEKVPRLYGLKATEVSEIADYCNAQ